jgi:hypothetical protein
MNFLDLLDVFTNLTLIGSNKKRNTTVAIVIFTILLLIAIVTFVIELVSILQCLSPLLFFTVFGFVGVIFSMLSIIGLYKTGIMEDFHKRDYGLIFSIVCLFTISVGSFINRQLGTTFDTTSLVSADPKKAANISHIPIRIDDNNMLLRAPAEIGNLYKKGDPITVTITEGFLNFDLIHAKVR